MPKQGSWIRRDDCLQLILHELLIFQTTGCAFKTFAGRTEMSFLEQFLAIPMREEPAHQGFHS